MKTAAMLTLLSDALKGGDMLIINVEVGARVGLEGFGKSPTASEIDL